MLQILDEPRVDRLPPEQLPRQLTGDRVIRPDERAEDTAAALAARSGMTVMQVALERWVDSPGQAPFQQVVRAALARLREMAAAG